MPPVHSTLTPVTHVISYVLLVTALYASTVLEPPLLRYADCTLSANSQVVAGPTDRSPPQEVWPPLPGEGARSPATPGVEPPLEEPPLFGLFDDPPEPPLDCSVTETLVEPGVAPGALPMTSMFVLPECNVASAVKTPFPTAAGLPCT
jgi:hypothetical protein